MRKEEVSQVNLNEFKRLAGLLAQSPCHLHRFLQALETEVGAVRQSTNSGRLYTTYGDVLEGLSYAEYKLKRQLR